MKLYVDTGLLAAYYTPEPLSAEAEELLRAFPGPAVSDLTEIELVAALALRVRAAGLASSDAQRVRTLFFSHLEDGFFVRLPLVRSHYHLAREWAARGTLAPTAALHLAAAALGERTLATADNSLVDAARELGVDVLPVGLEPGEAGLTIHEARTAEEATVA
jgi:uncharacterized protein